eukprot:5065902-Prymnesium_polylepis.1
MRSAPSTARLPRAGRVGCVGCARRDRARFARECERVSASAGGPRPIRRRGLRRVGADDRVARLGRVGAGLVEVVHPAGVQVARAARRPAFGGQRVVVGHTRGGGATAADAAGCSERRAVDVLHADVLHLAMRREGARPAGRVALAHRALSRGARHVDHLALPHLQRHARPTVACPAHLRLAAPVPPERALLREPQARRLRHIREQRRQHEALRRARAVGPSARAATAADSVRVERLLDALPQEGGARLGRAGHEDGRHHPAKWLLVRGRRSRQHFFLRGKSLRT